MSALEQVASFTQTPQMENLFRYLITLLGSVSMYLFSFNKGFEGATEMLKKLFPRKKKSFYARLDFLLVVFIGSAIGTICFRPEDSLQALAAGFGWVGAINIVLDQNRGVSQNV